MRLKDNELLFVLQVVEDEEDCWKITMTRTSENMYGQILVTFNKLNHRDYFSVHMFDGFFPLRLSGDIETVDLLINQPNIDAMFRNFIVAFIAGKNYANSRNGNNTLF